MSGRYEPVIDRHRADAASVGIDAIPSHIVGRRYLLVGAQPRAVFEDVLDRIAREGPGLEEGQNTGTGDAPR